MPDSKELWIHFVASVNERTIGKFIDVATEGFNNGFKKFNILLSTPGGTVFHGISAYHFLKSLPVKVVTYNMGQVHSIGGTFFVAGSERYCVPNSSFLVHAVSLMIDQPQGIEEKLLRERLGGIESDRICIANILSENTGTPLKEIESMMLAGTTIDPTTAKAKGFVHDIIIPQIPVGAPFVSITDIG